MTRVIDVLRDRFPQYKWKYDRKAAHWTCEVGWAHWSCSIFDSEGETPSHSQLYFYPDEGSPVHVASRWRMFNREMLVFNEYA